MGGTLKKIGFGGLKPTFGCPDEAPCDVRLVELFRLWACSWGDYNALGIAWQMGGGSFLGKEHQLG